jgi:hypothetical protein
MYLISLVVAITQYDKAQCRHRMSQHAENKNHWSEYRVQESKILVLFHSWCL